MAEKTLPATLTLIVDYEEVPNTEDLHNLVEEARGLGHIRTAILHIRKDTEMDLR